MLAYTDEATRRENPQQHHHHPHLPENIIFHVFKKITILKSPRRAAHDSHKNAAYPVYPADTREVTTAKQTPKHCMHNKCTQNSGYVIQIHFIHNECCF